jgi:SMI1 / KNR4 family (SUKH-1)
MHAGVDQALEALLRSGVISHQELQGCSDEEIRHLEAVLDVTVPSVYRDFLKVVGRRGGGLFRGSDFTYPQLLELRRWAEELLGEDASGYELPPDSVVLLMHHGYQFLFFRTAEGADPPV